MEWNEKCPMCGGELNLEHVGPVENPEHGFWVWCKCSYREREYIWKEKYLFPRLVQKKLAGEI